VLIDRDADTVRVSNGPHKLPRVLRKWFDAEGRLADVPPERVCPALQQLRDTDLPQIRISQEVNSWLEDRRRTGERKQLRHEYELKVHRGQWPAHETKVPLFPYQREGMLHLAFTERALLADEMGLGKTIQAIAACALLHRLGQACRVLIVTPASLKTEWEEQIRRFTDLSYQLVFGSRRERLKAYTISSLDPATNAFFTIVNYEQMLADALEVNARLRPDIVVLDEAQRIKNWSTKTAQAVKGLRSRYAFVLTGTQQEQEKLLRELAMLRMICDTNYILDPQDQECPKLVELEKVLEECRENDAKVLVFSEWGRMLELVRGLCQELDIGFAWHTGRVPQLRRRAEINTFKNDPCCRVFLSIDSGSTGLNLQNASVVINCDLPWNPAKLEQRVARAWRKNQTRPVTVINLVAENTLEHRMLDTLAHKQALADGVLDLKGDLTEIKLRGGRQAFLAKLQQLMGRPTQKSEVDGQPSEVGSRKPVLPTDRPLAFAQRVHETINGALLRCEERYPSEGAHSVLLVVVDGSPTSLEDALLPPLSHCWQEPLPLLRTFMADALQPWQPLAQSLEKLMPGYP
jgi:SNF2 family DNA or RNA helicase